MDNLQLPREEYFFLDFEALYLQKVAVLEGIQYINEKRVLN